MPKHDVSVHIELIGLDDAIEKANRLVDLLNEARRIVDSLYGKADQSEP